LWSGEIIETERLVVVVTARSLLLSERCPSAAMPLSGCTNTFRDLAKFIDAGIQLYDFAHANDHCVVFGVVATTQKLPPPIVGVVRDIKYRQEKQAVFSGCSNW
jgi:hypothetical protein